MNCNSSGVIFELLKPDTERHSISTETDKRYDHYQLPLFEPQLLVENE
jgi:hypothetical protein